MKILLVGNYEPDRQESMLRFVVMLEDGLRQLSHQVRVLRPGKVMGKLQFRGADKWLGYVDKLFLFPPVLKMATEWADIVHICDHSNAFYGKYIRGVPRLVTCHDILAIRSALGDISSHATRWSGRRLQAMILRGLKSAPHIAAVSEATKRDLLQKLGVPAERISVIYNGLNSVYSVRETHQSRGIVERLTSKPMARFLLHVGSNEWYKNRLGVLTIFSYLRKRSEMQDVKLLMVGPAWPSGLREFVAEQGLADCVTELVGVTDTELRALYHCAQAFLFPSLYEGFGWPIIEAQACGCLVATSDRAPMTEVGGEAAVYFDPDSPAEAAGIVAAALATAGASSSRERSVRNAARFTTAAMAAAYVEQYSEVRRVYTQADATASVPRRPSRADNRSV